MRRREQGKASEASVSERSERERRRIVGERSERERRRIVVGATRHPALASIVGTPHSRCLLARGRAKRA